MAQCKVHPESPLSGHPAADTSDLVRLGVSLSPDLLSPSVAESLRPGARQTLGLSPWTGTAPHPPTPPSRHFLPAPLPGGCSEAKTATPSLIDYLDALWVGAVKHRGGSGTRCPALPGVFLQWRSW